MRWQHSIKRGEGASEYKDKYRGFTYNENDKILDFEIPNEELSK